MLYECWRETAGRNAGEVALWDIASARRWTFRQLARAAEQGATNGHTLDFPSGLSAEFILQVLQAWRGGRVVCPIESGHPAPCVSGSLPRGTVHLKTTSATTGQPRLVAFAAEQLVADADNIVASMGLRPDWPNLGVISLAHSYGFSNLVLPLLLHGIPLILAGGALPELVRAGAGAAPSVTLAAVPALWQTWHHAGCVPLNVRLAISAGASLPLALERKVFQALGLKIHNFYGSSECGGIAYDASPTPREDTTAVGLPLQGVGVEIAPNGCVEVRSRAVGLAYWPEPNGNLQGGVFRTGDLGEIVSDWLCLRGRVTDRINVAGRKVAPEVIERALSDHPQVRGCVAFGMPDADPKRGEKIIACVATDASSEEPLKQFALGRLPAWQVPREWWLVDSLPVNGRGKLSRAEWRERYLTRRKP